MDEERPADWPGVPVTVIDATRRMRYLQEDLTWRDSPSFSFERWDQDQLAYKQRHLAVFVGPIEAAHCVFGIGIVYSEGRSGTYEEKIVIKESHALSEPVPTSLVTDVLGKAYADAAAPGQRLSDARGRRLLEALLQLDGNLARRVDLLIAAIKDQAIEGRNALIRGFERDAAYMAYQAVFGNRVIADGVPAKVNFEEPFVSCLPDTRSPADLDWLQLDDWDLRDVGYAARFYEGREADQKLLLVNMAKRRAEDVSGVDLVYYNPVHSSFVIVQYKEFTQGGSLLAYEPEPGLDEELARLQAIDDQCKDSTDLAHLRLHAQPVFLKLCEPSPFRHSSSEPIRGAYLPLPHFRTALTSPPPQPPQYSRYRVGTGDLPRHLNSTTFTQLLSDGWIGSCGVGSSFVRDQMKASLSGRGSLVFAMHTGPQGNSLLKQRSAT
ncbi:hypothetical protein GCM10022254_03220 [Actinomadura meridiana]|uniref:Uncharacterized protein n=1 Tax=Actinomadura meridiana TaxID=559626 RepID=A0ABP8BS15_9ACTN